MSDHIISTLCAHFELVDHDLDKEISDLHLDEIAETRCAYWKSLPSRLGLQDAVTRDIDKDFTEELDKRREFFQQWKQKKGSEATYRSLVRALLDIKQRHDAEYVSKLSHQAVENPSVETSSDPMSSYSASPSFPYLRAGRSMSEDQLSMLKERLYSDNNKLRLHFASLMFDLQKDMEKRFSVEEIINILALCDSHYEGVLEECTSFSKVFRRVRRFVSFFDYDLLEHLINKYGSAMMKKELDKYNGYFGEFAKRRVIECPSNAFEEREDDPSEKVVVLVADRILEKLTVDNLKKFKHAMNDIMGNKLLKVLRVKRGSVVITFRMFEDENFVITDEQQQALQREGVMRIIYGEKCFDMSPKLGPGVV